MASANEYFACVRAVVASTMIVEVEKIVYRDREPPEDEGPIKLAKETKKVQRSAALRAQRSAALPPQNSDIIEDTFPLVEFIAAPQKSGIIEDTFPLVEFIAAPPPQKSGIIEDTFPLVEFNQRSAAPRAQRSAAPPPQKKEEEIDSGGDATINRDDAVLYYKTTEVLTSSQVNDVHAQVCMRICICHTIARGCMCIYFEEYLRTYMHNYKCRYSRYRCSRRHGPTAARGLLDP
jgi:hypothetical protein